MSGSRRPLSFPGFFPQKEEAAVESDEDELDSDDEASLYFSISEGDPVGLARLIKDGLAPDTTFDGMNQLGKSLLHLCCEKGQTQCAEVLFSAGARVNMRDKWYQTPLMYAACTERLDMIEMMAGAGANLDKEDMYGKAALHFTVDHESTDCMKALLDWGAHIDAADSLGRTPLWFCASEEGHNNAMQCLLSYGANTMRKDIREKRTPIQAALAHTKRDTLTYLKLLTEAGSSVNCMDEYGHSCIMTLMKKYSPTDRVIDPKHLEYITLLISAGHDINLTCDSWTPGAWYQFHGSALNMAIEKDLFPFAELLLKLGADPDDYDDQKSSSPLMIAAYNNRLDIAKLLLSANCTMTAVSRISHANSLLHMTPFRCAVTKEHWDFTELLIEAGYDLKAEDYLTSNSAEIPSELVLNLDRWTRLIDYTQNPMSLLFICRNNIRDNLLRPLEPKINDLLLPTYLKDFLLLKKL